MDPRLRHFHSLDAFEALLIHLTLRGRRGSDGVPQRERRLAFMLGERQRS
jgi:hypothetical protein